MLEPERVRIFSGHECLPNIPVAHRGLSYGDAVFETMRVHAGQVPWWPRHWARLCRGAAVLRLPLPDPQQVLDESCNLFSEGGDGVLKLQLSRAGDRGYAPSADAKPVWMLSRHSLPPASSAAGLVLRRCRTTLAVQPLLAGIKHANRLEQVLARLEWSDLAADEHAANDGLLCDTDGRVVSAISANLFVLHDGHWTTPPVDRCGVAGVCREWALQALPASERILQRDDLLAADAVFLCNAVRGILPVRQLGQRVWPPHPAIGRAQALLAQAHPGFAVTVEAS